MIASMKNDNTIRKKIITINRNGNPNKLKMNESFNQVKKNNQNAINNNPNKSVIIDNKIKKQKSTYIKKNIINDSNLNQKVNKKEEKEVLQQYKFEENKTQKAMETKFSIIPAKRKKKFYLTKNNFSIIPEKENIYIIIRDINMSILKNEKNEINNNKILLTQDSSENLHFSILSSQSKSNELNDSKISNNELELPENPKGLNDFSSNCNMNSLLQCFYHIKSLRKSFMDPSKYSPETQKVCHSLSEIMNELSNGEEESYSPKTFKKVLGEINPSFAGNKLADVCDLYRTIIDSIIEEIPYEYPEENEDYDDKKKKL
jgi:hypothetical protein